MCEKIALKKFIRVPRSKEKSMIEKGDYETHCCGFIEWQPEEVESIAISETTIELHGSQGASSADAARSPQTAETIIAVARKNGVIEIARKTKKYFLGEVCSLFPPPIHHTSAPSSSPVLTIIRSYFSVVFAVY